MRVLITGVAGFLGSHLARRFVAEGHEVVGVDNFVTGARRNLDGLAGAGSGAEGSGRFHLVEHDISLPLFLAEGVDGVLHFASPASPVDYLELPIQTLKVGALGTHITLGIAKKHGARYLLASTSEVYGDPQVHPQDEDYWGHVNPVGPRGVYDEAKRFAEAMAMAYHRVHDVDVKVARIFNTYGPAMRPSDGRVVSNFLVQALRGEPLTVYGDGSQTRSFCYVDDLVEGVWRLFHSEWNGPMNLGNPDEFTILELAEVVRAQISTDVGTEHLPLPEDDPQVRCPDIGRAWEELDWEPRVSLAEGLARTAPYFRERVEEEGARARTLPE